MTAKKVEEQLESASSRLVTLNAALQRRSAILTRLTAEQGSPPRREEVAKEVLRREIKKTNKPKEHSDLSLDAESFTVAALDVIFVVVAICTSILTVAMWHPRTGQSFEDNPPSSIVSWLIFVYVFSAVWVGVRFFVRTRIGNWDVVDDLPSIRSEYLKSWLAYDIVFSAPLDVFFVGWANHVFYYLLLRHFLRFGRLLSLGRSVNPLLATRTWFYFISYLGSMVLVAHCVASVFWSKQGENVESLNYVQSLTWSVFTMATVGYGDILPTTDNMRAFSCGVMFLGICLLATFTTFANTVILDKDPIEAATDRRKAMVQSMLKHYSVPWDLEREVLQTIEFALNKGAEKDVQAELELFPGFIQNKLTPYISSRLVRQVNCLQNFGDDAMLRLSSCSNGNVYQSGKSIFVKGEVVSKIFFVVSGSVEVEIESGETLLARTGEYFGTELLDVKSVAARAIANSEIVSLNCSELKAALGKDFDHFLQTLNSK